MADYNSSISSASASSLSSLSSSVSSASDSTSSSSSRSRTHSAVSRVGRENQVYTPSGSRTVVGVVPRLEDGRLVLISSRKYPEKWILPKGGAETDETLEESALREAWEEAGVLGTIVRQCHDPIPHYKVNDQGVPSCEFTFFVMAVTSLSESWPESQQRQRCIVSIGEAEELLLSGKEGSLFQQALKTLKIN
ncbi:diphosphoinositol polyphosphate phosphohydrolase DDP1 [Zopfochytrium polystomum]|nr:diphosphoinositol polyphosphate phosphohydrolase DDP1 [Zopfochytrium polystomum]